VSRYYKIRPTTLKSVRRGLENEPRDVAMYLIRSMRSEPLMRVGASFGLNRYSSVSSAVMRVKTKLQKDRKFKDRLEHIESDQKQKDFYLQLRDKVQNWFEKNATKKPAYANYILLVPDFFYLLVMLTLDDRIAAIDKAKFAGVLAYFFSPIDFLPEALLGPV
jgi:uncharacterized membrane protein YkvA (DUF1232 family)